MNPRIKRPVLRYHGGKFVLAPWILEHFTDHRVYTEVFGGGGSVLMQKPRSYAEVYNDLWGSVVNVFRVLRDRRQAAELQRVVALTPFSREEFEQCSQSEIDSLEDPIERARRTILRSFAGFGSASTNGNYSTGFRANANRSGTTPAMDWKNYPNHIWSFVTRLQGVVIENKDYRDVLLQHDCEDALHFIDPPYVHATRNLKRGNASYVHEFSDDDHREMSDIIKGLKGAVVLCGYPSELYDELFPPEMFTCIRREAYADGAAKRVECLWVNRAKRLRLF